MGFGVSLITTSPNTTIESSVANENWTSINNATVYTGNVTASGTNVVTIMLGAYINFSANGSLANINYFSGSGSGTFNHGLGTTPHAFSITYAGNFGSAPSHQTYWYNANSTSVQVIADSGYSWIALAYRAFS